MKLKCLITLGLVPLALTSCGSGSLSLEQMKEYVNTIENTDVYPFYRVRGACNFNNEYIEVDSEFVNDFREYEYVPYTRYNEGFLDPNFDNEDALTFANGSKSYWARMPLRITKDNFYGEVDDGRKISINSSCAYYQLYHYMKTWSDSQVKNADPGGEVVMQLLKDKEGNTTGFVFYGENLHSKITFDNFPIYPDTNDIVHFPYGVDYLENPMFKNEIDASFNFRFEYNSLGFLTREYIASVNYNDKESSDTQFCAEALYTYRFE